MASELDPGLITARRLGQLLSVDENTCRRWARDGLIPVVRLPRMGVRFEYSAVRRALEANAAVVYVASKHNGRTNAKSKCANRARKGSLNE